MADYQTIEAGSANPRGFTLVNRKDGAPLKEGDAHHLLVALTGAEAGKWWNDSTEAWQATPALNLMTHRADGHWTRALAASPWEAGELYLEYAMHAAEGHVPISRFLKAEHTPAADAQRRALLDLEAVAQAALSGAGAHAARVILEDDDEERVPLARVTVKNAAQTATVAVGTTDASGEVVFQLDDGEYRALVHSAPGFLPLAAQTLVVDGGAEETYTLTRFQAGAPAAASLCRIFGWLTRADGSAAAGVAVRFSLHVTGAFRAASSVIVVNEVVVTTDASGFFQADLTRSSELEPLAEGEEPVYRVQSREARLAHLLTVPDEEDANLTELELTPLGQAA